MLTYVNPNFANNVPELRPNFRRQAVCCSSMWAAIFTHLCSRNLFAEAASAGFLVKNSSGLPYIQSSATKSFTFGSLDVTNPAAVSWFQQIVRCNMLFDRTAECSASVIPANATIGVGGWMSDFGEYLPFDSVVHEGTASYVHNSYAPRSVAAAVDQLRV